MWSNLLFFVFFFFFFIFVYFSFVAFNHTMYSESHLSILISHEMCYISSFVPVSESHPIDRQIWRWADSGTDVHWFIIELNTWFTQLFELCYQCIVKMQNKNFQASNLRFVDFGNISDSKEFQSMHTHQVKWTLHHQQ